MLGNKTWLEVVIQINQAVLDLAPCRPAKFFHTPTFLYGFCFMHIGIVVPKREIPARKLEALYCL